MTGIGPLEFLVVAFPGEEFTEGTGARRRGGLSSADSSTSPNGAP